jgi:hypothetical protein
MSEVAHASDQSRMSWTDENHHLILTMLSVKAALVFSQLIRRGAKCCKEQETAFGETGTGSRFYGQPVHLPVAADKSPLCCGGELLLYSGIHKWERLCKRFPRSLGNR